jgi:signal transduction histidine kinase
LLKDKEGETRLARGSTRRAVVCSIAVVVALVCALAWAAIMRSTALPELVSDVTQLTPLAPWVSGAVLLLSIAALGLLWLRQRSVLDLWLAVALVASLPDIGLAVFLSTVRFSVGWYAARVYALITGTVVLLVLLSETTKLYVTLARANVALRREREARLLTLDSLVSAVAHEIKQSLTGIITNSQASKKLLAKDPPDLDEAGAALDDIINDGRRVTEVISGIRTLVGRDPRRVTRFDVNDVVREVLGSVVIDLRTHGVSASMELSEGLPHMQADRVLVEHVLLNLITNAIQAMDPLTERPRLLRVRSELSAPSGILVTVEDSGPGITAKHRDSIFEPFFTTKANGMGMGLAICRSIIELHNGKLWASDGRPHGTVFHVELPAESGR